jgi:hypothetical protein
LRTCSFVVAATWCFLVRSDAVALWIMVTAISVETTETATGLLILFMVISPGLSLRSNIASSVLYVVLAGSGDNAQKVKQIILPGLIIGALKKYAWMFTKKDRLISSARRCAAQEGR